MSKPFEGIEATIDCIYEAAIIPEMWPDVLDQLASLSSTEGGVLFSIPSPSWRLARSNEPEVRWICSESVRDLWQNFARDGWLGERNAWYHRGLKTKSTGFMADQDMFSTQEIEDEPLYKYLRFKGFGWGAGLFVISPSKDILVFDFERKYALGPVERLSLNELDRFKSHLSRSALLSARLGMERVKASTDALTGLGLPAAVLSNRHRIISNNQLFNEHIPNVFIVRKGERICLINHEADCLLEKGLLALSNSTALQHGIYSIPVPPTDNLPALVLHLLPVRRAARDIFALASAILIVTPVKPTLAPSAQVIQGLFDLTGAEARIAQMILYGKTISDIARASSTTEGTVRCQLKSVFSKTGVRRQADLVSLLSGVLFTAAH